jgi:hypothetical protein
MRSLLIRMDEKLLHDGWQDPNTSGAALWYVRDNGTKLVASQVNIPDMDDHNAPASVVMYEVARVMNSVGFGPDADGMAFTCEAYMAALDLNAGVAERDQFHQARKQREFFKYPGRREVRTISVVMRDGTEAGLIRERVSEEVHIKVGPQFGLVYRGLRLLLGLPEDDALIPPKEFVE